MQPRHRQCIGVHRLYDIRSLLGAAENEGEGADYTARDGTEKGNTDWESQTFWDQKGVCKNEHLTTSGDYEYGKHSQVFSYKG